MELFSTIQPETPTFSFSFLHTIKFQAFWTSCALIVALFLTSFFSRRTKHFISRLRKGKSVIIPQPLLHPLCDSDHDEESDLSDSESDEEEEESDSASSQQSDDEYESSSSALFESQTRFDDDFRVAGRRSSGELSFSWSEFMNGKGVVKSWDGLGLGLEKASESLISFLDLNKSEITHSSMPSPAVLMSAGFETSRNVALRVFDTRVGRQIPQIFAEWQPIRKKYGGSADVSDGGSLVVRDIRKIGSAVENLTESDVKTWWDGDAVIVDGCCFGKDYGGGSVVSRCRNAVFSSLF